MDAETGKRQLAGISKQPAAQICSRRPDLAAALFVALDPCLGQEQWQSGFSRTSVPGTLMVFAERIGPGVHGCLVCYSRLWTIHRPSLGPVFVSDCALPASLLCRSVLAQQLHGHSVSSPAVRPTQHRVTPLSSQPQHAEQRSQQASSIASLYRKLCIIWHVCKVLIQQTSNGHARRILAHLYSGPY